MLQNTTQGNLPASLRTVSADQDDGNTTFIIQDATNEQVIIQRVEPDPDELGNPVPVVANGSITVNLSDAAGHTVKLREIQLCDSTTGEPVKMLILASEPYA